jgi:hypothetical protein
LADAFDWVGNLFVGIPLIGPFVRAFFHWIGTILSAAFDFQATLMKGVLNLLAGFVAGQIRIIGGGIGGLLAWDGRLFVKGVGDFASGIVGPVIAIGGKIIALVQAALFSQFGERPLTASEADMVSRVYRGSLALYNVRIVDGFAGLFSTNDRAFTFGNKIYMKDTSPALYAATLVHECCHLWQNQHLGTRYLADAIWGQATLPGQGYSWRAELTRGHFRWQDFNKEAQAAFLEDVFTTGKKLPSAGSHIPGEFYDDDPVGPNVEFKGTGGIDFTGLARESVLFVRSA